MVNYGDKLDCIDDEVQAFTAQVLLAASLTDEEMRLMNLRLQEGYSNLPSQLQILWDLLKLRDGARNSCNSDDYDNCFYEYFNSGVKQMVMGNPYYQKQCGL